MKRLLFLCTFLSSTLVVAVGNENGHGGDFRSSAFVSTAYDILTDLRERPIQGLDEAKLAAAIFNTKVHSTESVLTDLKSGAKVDAINRPEKNEILLNRSAWDSTPQGFEKRRLVLHEYLNIAGYDDRNYQLSSLIDRAKVCQRHPVIRKAIENAFAGISCDRLEEKDLSSLKLLKILDDKNISQLKKVDFSGLNLKEIYFEITKFKELDSDLKKQIRSLSTNIRSPDTMDKKTFFGYTQLQSLELSLEVPVNTDAFESLRHLKELIVVSSPRQDVTLKNGTFGPYKKSNLKRIVLCDSGEVLNSDYVRIPNLKIEERGLQGLENVEEATLCLRLSDFKKPLGSVFLSELKNVKHLWLKLDDWSMVADDFFVSLPKETRLALIPSGRFFKDGEFSRFKGIDCSKGWNWGQEKKHQFVAGKTYCVRNP